MGTETKRIDEDLALAAGDLLASIKALRIEAFAPFEPLWRSDCR